MGPAATHREVVDRPLAPVSLRDLRDVDPYPAYERIRAVGSVVWDEGMAAWLVLSHEGCTFVLRREDLFEEPTGTLPDAARIVGRRDIRSLVGEPHEVLHRSVSHAWRPMPIEPLAMAAVRPLVEERLARVGPDERFELFAQFARLLPISVISRVLGPAGCRHRHARPRQGLDGGRAGVAPLVRRGP